ncbi:MAG: phosphoribosylglycinamide formyltransferase [Planctomycetes bacterium]|nr:phosphoribosylglycinamide formyltransferase [Planctomycetota bacterium]
MMTRLAVLVSGSGRSVRNLLELERAGDLATETVLVISSKAGVQALDHAAAFDVPTRVLKTAEITAALDDVLPDIVVMAGYLRRWPIPDHYVGKTINIHPSLLPRFGGKGFFGHHVHEAVLASGTNVSGCTVHYVTANYDEGPIIAQRTVEVRPGDDAATLADRVFEQELILLPSCIRLVAEGDVRLEGGRAVFT